MNLTSRARRIFACTVPLFAVVALSAGCSSPTPHKALTGGLATKVPQPSNCQFNTKSNPIAHELIGLKATAKSGVTTKQIGAQVRIPDEKTLPCASGANYVPGPPVQVSIYILKGATLANQNTIAATLRSSGLFATVTVVPQP